MLIMSESEALSRIEIDSLLKQSGWKLGLTDPDRNVDPEYRTPIGIKGKPADYVLMDSKGFPLCTLEAKNITKSPLDGKEQARKYANAINSRFIILSNGIEHYFWDLESGNPTKVTLFPSPGNLESRRDNFKPQEVSSNEETIEEDYIALTQMSDYKNKPAFKASDLHCLEVTLFALCLNSYDNSSKSIRANKSIKHSAPILAINLLGSVSSK